jgi:cell division protein FtsB
MRWIIAVFALALAAMQLELWFGDDRLPERNALRADVALQSAENEALAERNADLAAEIRNLRQGSEAAEERARANLGLMRADETYYQIAEID